MLFYHFQWDQICVLVLSLYINIIELKKLLLINYFLYFLYYMSPIIAAAVANRNRGSNHGGGVSCECCDAEKHPVFVNSFVVCFVIVICLIL